MKLISFVQKGKTRVGALTDRGVADLTALGCPDNMNDVIAGGTEMLRRIAALIGDGRYPVLDFSSLDYANVTQPQKILFGGLNYKSHAQETGGDVPENIVFFSKFNDALTPAGKPVALPEWQRCYDYEAELVVVMGSTAWMCPKRGVDYFRYTCGND
jgi:2-keto-4-pentenoate hydratase/2-oxohepta-3-ene-1,7-dioic acid hydratase in catechol pathway